MLRPNMLALAIIGITALASGACVADPSASLTNAPLQAAQHESAPREPLVVARSCASDCQSQHDRCRVETKGSPTCDEIRQRCLQVCLQKRKK